MDKRIVIIDGNSLVNRAFYAIQRPMITKDGFYTQGIYGFLSMLTKIRSEYSPSHMLVAFDRKAPTFRHMEYADYKAGRRKMPPELAMEMPVLKDILDAMGIMRYELDGFEADDIIGTTAAMAEDAQLEALVITGDKDALQLATDKTSVLITKKGISEFKLYDNEAMNEEFGFDHIQFIDYKGLRGDPSDNIPGVPGVGEKTAIKLIQQFGSIENLIQHTDEICSAKLREKIEENLMTIMMSKRLATIIRNVPVDYSIEDCRIKTEDRDRLIEIYSRLEFSSYLKKLSSEGAISSAAEKNHSAEMIYEKLPVEYCGSFENARITINDTASFESVLSKDTVWIWGEGSESHVGLPDYSVLAVCAGDEYCILCGNGSAAKLASAVSGKKLRFCGFDLEKIYYPLFMHGADLSDVTTEFDCSLAEYVLAPTSKSRDLDTVLLERFHYAGDNAQAQMDMFSDQSKELEEIAKKLFYLKQLKTLQEEQIHEKELDTVLRLIELPLCKVLASMEAKGIYVNSAELSDFGTKLRESAYKLEQQIYELAGEKFNINSPKQLGVILFEKLGLPSAKKTKSGYSTGAEVLEKLAPFSPIVSLILEYRTLTKLNSTYVEGMLPLICEDGKIRAHFQQTVTATGRISCTEPNLQNIPVRSELGRQLRRAFVPESSDYVFIGADYSQIELRVLAHMSADPTLIRAFNDGLDIHRETASKVFGVPQNEVTPVMRSNAKAVNFGVIYGMSGFGLATELTISRKEAEQYISDYFERFKDVKLFMDRAVSDCRGTGVSKTLFGRRRDVPEISASQYMVRQLGERLAMNTPIQGTAADIIKLAMIKVYDALQKECKDSRLILQIHDELIIQARRDEAEKVRSLLVRSMENAAQLDVKLEVSLGEGESWFDLK